MRSHLVSLAGTLAAAMFVATLICPLTLWGDVPLQISYQGRLTDSHGSPLDTTVSITFRIYRDPLAMVLLWSEEHRSVEVVDGLFHVRLGSNIELPASVFDGGSRWLQYELAGLPPSLPLTAMVSVPYAYSALEADTCAYAGNIPSGLITDVHVSPSANISRYKIGGTAATLSGGNTFAGTNEFQSTVSFGDSIMRVNSNAVGIGRNLDLGSTTLLHVHRGYNTTAERYGIRSVLENKGTGNMYGVEGHVTHATAGSAGIAHGISGFASSDGDPRYGAYGYARAYNTSLTTGTSYGVYGSARDGANAYGVYGYATSATTNYAGYFSGAVNVTGTLTKGGGGFRIDHPLDAENKCLQHSFVESPDMMNVYNGNVVLDEKGEATVQLPDYFEAINSDFRYQLTCIGGFAPVYVSEKVAGNRFKIAGGSPGLEVSWQVTGIRNDPFAKANRIQVEVDKRPEERGKYLHPEAFNLPLERGVDWESIKRTHEEESRPVE